MEEIQRGGVGGVKSKDFNKICAMEVAEILSGRLVYFDIQVAFDIAWDKYFSDKGQAVTNLGIVKPPFDSMWFEWSLPKYMYAGTEGGGFNKLGCCAMAIKPGFLSMIFILKGPSGTAFVPVSLGVLYDQDTGNFLQSFTTDLDKDEIEIYREPDDEVESVMPFFATPVLTALSLINCRNVTTEETGRITFARSGTEKRRGVPAKVIRYRTIILPGGGSVSDGKGGHRATALHRVRGHFKTFTPERPLLGKHVGTYWWGWQVRGNKEKGTIISDYKIKGQR